METPQELVYGYLTEHQAEIGAFLSRLIQFDTQNLGQGGPAVEAEAQAYIAECFAAEGLDTVSCAFDEAGLRPNVRGTLKGVGGGKSILLHAHMDTGDVDAEMPWLHDPLGGVIENGIVYGRGAVDDKGGVAAMYWAIKAIRACGVRLRGDATICSVVAEETAEGGILGAGPTVAGMEKLPDLSISCEGTEMDFELSGSTVTKFSITVKGKGGFIACHNQGAYPQPYGMACGNAVYVDTFAKAMILIQLLYRLEQDWNLNHRHPVWGSGGRGGFDTNGVGLACINLMDICCQSRKGTMDSCTLTYRVHANPDWTVAEINERITSAIHAVCQTDSWLKENPPEIRLSQMNDFPGHYLPLEHAYTELCADVYEGLFGRRPIYSTGRCNDDAAWIARLGIPAFTVGAAGAARMHNVNECMEIAALTDAAKLYAGIIMAFCQIEA